MKLHPFGLALLALASFPASTAENAMKAGTYRNTTTVQISSQQPVTSTDEECLTEEEARDVYKVMIRELSTEEDCTLSNLKSSGGQVTFDLKCKDAVGGDASESRVEMTFGGEWYKADFTTKMGKEIIRAKVDSRWLHAGCDRKE